MCLSYMYNIYRPMTNLREGNVFIRVCDFVKGDVPLQGLAQDPLRQDPDPRILTGSWTQIP